MADAWNGLYPALWIPTHADGRLQTSVLADQVRFLKGAGADGVMALGSTGEFVHLDVDVRCEVLRAVAEAVPDWPIIANISDISPLRVAELGRFARAVGAQAVSLLPPWFFRLPGKDVVEFLVRGAESAGLPLILYNYPELTGHRLGLETIAAVADRVRLVAIKQSGEEFSYHRELATLGAEKGFTVITGADVRIPEAFALGAQGVVSGLSNALPEMVASVLQAVRGGDDARAQSDSARLREFLATTAGLDFPLNMAAAMRARGRETGAFKAVLSVETLNRFTEAVDQGRRLLTAWGIV